jgi:hypothetical protein
MTAPAAPVQYARRSIGQLAGSQDLFKPACQHSLDAVAGSQIEQRDHGLASLALRQTQAQFVPSCHLSA